MGEMRGRVAVVTGAAQGVGRATAELLAREGARVALFDINARGAERAAAAIRRRRGWARAYAVDVADFSGVEAGVRAFARDAGRPTILVNCAVITTPHDLFKMSLAEWDRVLAVDLGGYMHTCRAVMPGMLRARGGAIVNISSLAGLRGSISSGPHYSAAKAGILGLTKALARDFGPRGIRVNAIAPGLVDTPLAHQMNGDLGRFVPNIPLRRIGRPEDIAEAAAFLVSDRASYITGVTLIVDGGRSLA
jgi:3-oxoacyl-[acyl-carrier protein] reductase